MVLAILFPLSISGYAPCCFLFFLLFPCLLAVQLRIAADLRRRRQLAGLPVTLHGSCRRHSSSRLTCAHLESAAESERRGCQSAIVGWHGLGYPLPSVHFRLSFPSFFFMLLPSAAASLAASPCNFAAVQLMILADRRRLGQLADLPVATYGSCRRHSCAQSACRAMVMTQTSQSCLRRPYGRCRRRCRRNGSRRPPRRLPSPPHSLLLRVAPVWLLLPRAGCLPRCTPRAHRLFARTRARSFTSAEEASERLGDCCCPPGSSRYTLRER
ncbi:unnamed protein product [Prorocentrum cordatum]|uniref:Uncharacterized protein n=1 Tax=Prorocentrum cordatum TaxID=2364126 RepID=A0ABN9WUM3_9DINO|nr:unnamed protein product [Polarella glacialis]